MLNNFNAVEFQRKQRSILSKKLKNLSPREILEFFNKRMQEPQKQKKEKIKD